MEKIIKITVSPEGQAQIEAEGFKGEDCKLATAKHEAIYNNVITHQDKPELYEGASCQAGAKVDV